MSSNVVSLSRLFRRNWDWSSQELAEFYRVETALLQAGLRIDTERGVSECGDPWFVFCRQDGEVIVHIARIDGEYILAGSSYEGIARGRDIGALVRNLVARHPLVQMPGAKGARGSNLFLHPAALLVAVVATAFFKSSEASAMAGDGSEASQGRVAIHAGSSGASKLIAESLQSIAMDAVQIALVLTAVSSLFNGNLDPAALFSIDSEGPTDHSDTAQTLKSDSDLQSSPSRRSADSPSAVLLTSSDLPRSDGDGAADGNNTLKMQGIDIKALPLVAVLWDLSSQHLENRSTPSEASSDDVILSDSIHLKAEFSASALLVVNMKPAEAAAGDLPAVQSAKISFSAGGGTVQTHEINHLDQLPAVLTSVLQQAVHTQVQWTPVGGFPNSSSLADALIGTIVIPTIATLPSSAPASDAADDHSSVAEVPTQSEHGTATIHGKGAAVSAVELQEILENFIQSSPNYSITTTGKGAVVIYDVHAITTESSAMKSISFDFGDGSSLSLVGLPQTLPYAYIMA